MSWFDTSGFASLAKSALKEAQKTIDKALDIQDDEYVPDKLMTNTPMSPDSSDADNFFSSWGVTPSLPTESPPLVETTKSMTKSPKKAPKPPNMPASLWGSFTGSFFDVAKDSKTHWRDAETVESLADDSVDEKFNESKLVVHEMNEDIMEEASEIKTPGIEENTVDAATIEQSPVTFDSAAPVVVKRKERPSSAYYNRLSIISSESGRNSSESVEVLGSCDTGCTSTPESELISLGHSVSTPSSGVKNSDSVDFSLTSPSSIEVLSSSNLATDDEFISPTGSDFAGNLDTSESISKVSPDSIEVIPEDDEDPSNADDSVSFASFSESTMNTVLEQFQPKYEPQNKLRDMTESTQSDLSLSPDKSYSSFGEPITRPPSKTGMQLVLAHTTKDTVCKDTTLIDTQPQVSNQSITLLVESPNVINPAEIDDRVTSAPDPPFDDSALSDRTVTASDADGTFMESSTETVTTTDSSLYVKNMLADAMIDKTAELPASDKLAVVRGQSPVSSESRSDLIKIESEHTSDHTSGDELETTTSSDIEIISSPNGDSSSTQSVSRQSPAKLGFKGIELVSKSMITKIKGHNRELSEASSHSDDSHSEVEKLLKRISEMTEILEAREAKLNDISRKNMELAEGNADLQRQLDVVHSKQIESFDLNQVTEEYTQRMSALERKFQQAIRERDNLRKQMDALKQESSNRVPKNDFDSLIREKDDTIKELREEGEKLSKIQLHHSNIIKKLRITEKEMSTELKRLKDLLEESTSENDRLKRSLSAKEEVERSQIEAVHQLTAKTNKLDRENSLLKSQLDDTTQKLDTVKTSLDAAKKELADKKQASHELVVREQTLAALETAKQITQSQNEEIISQLEDLRDKLRQAEHEYSRKETALRQENTDLLRRLENSEARNEELAESVSQATKPLIRQLDNLQSTYNFKQTNWEKQEQDLLDKLAETQSTLMTLTENERISRQECINLRSRVSSLETNLNTALQQNDCLSTQIEQLKASYNLANIETQKETAKLQQLLENVSEEMEKLKVEFALVSEKLSGEKKALEAEKRKVVNLQEQLQQRAEQYAVAEGNPCLQTRDSSPTLSLGRLSLSESLGSVVWPQDETFDCGASTTGRFSTVYDSVRGNPTAVLENLQSTLKLRDGEVQQMQWEMARRDSERTILTNELSQLTVKLDVIEERMVDYERLKEQLQDIGQKYEAMCQMYGEKVEEVQELKMDLQDVKEMYKSQIDDLLNKQQSEK